MGKRIWRLNPESEWIVTELPALRIVDDELWQAVKARQTEIAEKHVIVTRQSASTIRTSGRTAHGVRSRSSPGSSSAAVATVSTRYGSPTACLLGPCQQRLMLERRHPGAERARTARPGRTGSGPGGRCRCRSHARLC
nr:hypothetical protein [Bradyrhizobium sp. SZCCHNS2022]